LYEYPTLFKHLLGKLSIVGTSAMLTDQIVKQLFLAALLPKQIKLGE
jgi:hypothetical protein